MTYRLSRSKRTDKKWQVVSPGGKTIHFGANGYEDYTIHRDPERLRRYDMRHAGNENWGKSGINTAGFWAKWILWNKPGLKQSIDDTSKRFRIKIVLCRDSC